MAAIGTNADAFRPTTAATMMGGNQQLARRLGDGLPDVRLSVAVEQIDRRDDRVSLIANGVAGRERIEGDAMVVAVRAAIFGRIDIIPPLHPPLIAMLRQVVTGDAAKIAVATADIPAI